jgi:death-on-curing protein
MSAIWPFFLTREQIEELHDSSLAQFGGSAGVRDEGLIDSALASAKNAFFYGRGDLFDIAAAYAFHLAEAQAFLDGNKRTAIGAALTFLDLNGIENLPEDNRLYDAMIAIAKKELTKAGLAALLRECSGSQN